jgi:hypothetical protein
MGYLKTQFAHLLVIRVLLSPDGGCADFSPPRLSLNVGTIKFNFKPQASISSSILKERDS